MDSVITRRILAFYSVEITILTRLYLFEFENKSKINSTIESFGTRKKNRITIKDIERIMDISDILAGYRTKKGFLERSGHSYRENVFNQIPSEVINKIYSSPVSFVSSL